MNQHLTTSIFKAGLGLIACCVWSPLFGQTYTYDFVWYSGAAQTWVYEAGPKLLVDVSEDPATADNDVLFVVRNAIDTELGYLSSIADLQFDTGSLLPDMFSSVSISIVDSLGYLSYQMYPVGAWQTLIDLSTARVAWSGEYAAGTTRQDKTLGINPGEYLVFRAILNDGVSFSDIITAMNLGGSANYVGGHYGQWTTAQKQYYRAEATKGLRINLLVHSIIPNSVHQDGHGLFVPRGLVAITDDTSNTQPRISSATATPSTLLDTETSRLLVTADDPDGGPGALRYQWTVVSGGGLFDDAESASPVYVPADVVGDQTVTVRVTVSDGEASVSEDLTLTVQDANPPPAGIELLAEDFSGGTLAGWRVVDEGTYPGPSKWGVASGELTQLSNIYGGSTTSGDLVRPGTYLLYDAGLNWADYRVRFKMRTTDNDGLGLMFRVANKDNYYRFSWDKELKQRRLVKKAGGAYTLLAADSAPYVVGQSYEIEIVAHGAQIELWIDGVRIFQATDTSLTQGTVAFYTWRNDRAYFDDLVVTGVN